MVVGLALVAALVTALPADAGRAQAATTTRAEAAALARAAVDDDRALAELRGIEELDGRPVDLAAATAALGGDRRARLAALADALAGPAEPGDPPVDREASRQVAEQVLEADKYQEDQVPRPFQGALAWLADRLRPVGRALGRVIDPILGLPGGPVILLVLIVAAGGTATAWLISRRSRAVVTQGGAGSLVDPALDPDEVAQRADDAEAAGDLTVAIRLRYQAGLLRLARAGELVLRPDTTAEGAARQVGRPAMDELTRDFEEIVYGDRVATEADVRLARRAWPEVLGARSSR